MELEDIFYLSGDELRVLVHAHIFQYNRDESQLIVLDTAPKDNAGIMAFGIDIYPTWEIGNVIHTKGAAVLMTDPFFVQDNSQSIKTQIFAYIARPNQYISCVGLGEIDKKYSYDEGTTGIWSAYLGETGHYLPTYFTRLTYGVPRFLYTGFDDQNEWMTLSSALLKASDHSQEKTNYLIFYINPQTLGK